MTTAEFNALIPTLVEKVLEEARRGPESQGNLSVSYEDSGLSMEICFYCQTEWEYYPGDYWSPSELLFVSGHGYMTDISACYESEDGEEYHVFSNEELYDIGLAIDEALTDF